MGGSKAKKAKELKRKHDSTSQLNKSPKRGRTDGKKRLDRNPPRSSPLVTRSFRKRGNDKVPFLGGSDPTIHNDVSNNNDNNSVVVRNIPEQLDIPEIPQKSPIRGQSIVNKQTSNVSTIRSTEPVEPSTSDGRKAGLNAPSGLRPNIVDSQPKNNDPISDQYRDTVQVDVNALDDDFYQESGSESD